jgi:hypothetical protein
MKPITTRCTVLRILINDESVLIELDRVLFGYSHTADRVRENGLTAIARTAPHNETHHRPPRHRMLTTDDWIVPSARSVETTTKPCSPTTNGPKSTKSLMAAACR